MVDFEEITRLNNELKEFLRENPELQELQDEINKKLENVKDPHNRCAIVQEMMLNSLNELVEPLRDLSALLEGRPTTDQLVARSLERRVRIRCTNRKCSSSSGIWTDKMFKDDYLTYINCQLCGSKYAEALTEVK